MYPVVSKRQSADLSFVVVRGACAGCCTHVVEGDKRELILCLLHAKRLSSRQLVAITITGDSMAPALKDGDLVVVDTRETHPVSDGIYILVTDNSLIAKRVQLAATGGIWLHSDNPAYQDQLIPASDTDRVRFVGRVVWAGGEL